MDFVLGLCDDYFLDNVWATLLPASAFAPSSLGFAALNGSSHMLIPPSDPDTWSHLMSYIPHPSLPVDLPTLAASSAWPRDYIPRQLISLFVLTYIGIHAMYFAVAGLSYKFIFNHEMMKHPRFLKNQVRKEIQLSLKAFPAMILYTIPWFQAEVMGYSRLYDNIAEYGWAYFVFSSLWFLLFTDYCIYWVHRWEHNPLWYKWLHKPHHKWIIPTPFASHAFHPLDGYFQSLPYHFFIFVFPLHRMLYLCLFAFVNCWSIFIHDSDMVTDHPLEKVINGPAHHTLHHLYFTVNYGQYFTFSDRMGNSYRQPESGLDPLLEVKALEARKQKEAQRKQE